MNQALNPQPAMPDFSALLEDRSDAPAGPQIDFKRLLWGVWQYRLMIIAVTFAFGLGSIALALTALQPTWTGRTTLLQKEQQDEFRVGRYGLPFKAQEYAFKTLLDTLLLPGTLDSAMRQAGVSMPSHELARLIDVHIGRESKAFTISVAWSDPETAAKLTNSLADVFINRNRAMRRSEIETSLINYRERLHNADAGFAARADTLLAFEATNDISDINTQLMVLLEKRQELEVNLRSLEGDLLSSNEEDSRLADHIAAEPDMIVQSSYYVNPLQKNLAQIEWELAQARGRYTDDNPKVKDLILRIDKIKALIASGTDNGTPSETFANNPVKQELTITRYEAKAEGLRLETRVTGMTNMLAELTGRINELTRQRKSHQALTLEKESALDLQRDLRQRVDSLEVLLLGQIGDFELLERANLPTQPGRTGRTLLVAGLTLLGLMAAVLVALGREYLTNRIRTVKDLELCTDIALISEIASCAQPGIDLNAPTSILAGHFRRFTNDLQQCAGQRQLAFISVESGAGTTTAALNCALGMQMKGESVALVDADLRPTSKPLEFEHPQVCTTRPLYDLLQMGAAVDNTAAAGNVKPESGPAARLPLQFTPAGDHQRQAEDVLLIGGRAMDEACQTLASHREWIIYNLPPISEQEAAFEALQHIGRAVLVVRSGQTSKRDLAALLARMQRHGISIAAAIICDVPAALATHGQVMQPGDVVSDVRKLFAWIAPARLRFAAHWA